MTPAQDDLARMADRIVAVDGVVAVALGGSRARGDAVPGSDVDLGVYYRGRLDVVALRQVATEVADAPVELTEPGGWGAWVDGGGWLRVRGTAVDWVYRDLDRVHGAWADAQAGRFTFHPQVGHPLGVLDVAYAGEVALGVVLTDPSGELTALQEAARVYPAALSRSLVGCLWEAGFTVDLARKALPRCDTTYVAGCLFRAVLLCAHSIYARARRWLVNEKGAVTAAGGLACAPVGFAVDAHRALAELGTTAAELAASVDAVADLVVRTAAATGYDSPAG